MLDSPARLIQLQILSHEYKVCCASRAQCKSAISMLRPPYMLHLTSLDLQCTETACWHHHHSCPGDPHHSLRARHAQITSRVEVFVAQPDATGGGRGARAWWRLGFLSLEEQSGHQVRISAHAVARVCSAIHSWHGA